jgi:hypothetical protein
MFLEIYGNSHIRKQTSAYVQGKVPAMVRFLTDTKGGEFEQKLSELVDVSLLKSKQRDAIEKVSACKNSDDVRGMMVYIRAHTHTHTHTHTYTYLSSVDLQFRGL